MLILVPLNEPSSGSLPVQLQALVSSYQQQSITKFGFPHMSKAGQ